MGRKWPGNAGILSRNGPKWSENWSKMARKWSRWSGFCPNYSGNDLRRPGTLRKKSKMARKWSRSVRTV